MQWTRRAWLQTVLSGAIAIAVVDPLAIIPAVRARFDPSRPFWIDDMLVSANDAGYFRLERSSETVFMAPLGKRSTLRWWSVPGFELQGTGLVNASDFDVRLLSTLVRQGAHRFAIDEHGVAQSLAA